MSKECEKFNATLVEIQILQKQIILETYLGQLDLESNCLGWIGSTLVEILIENGNGLQVEKSLVILIGARLTLKMIMDLIVFFMQLLILVNGLIPA